MGIPHQNLPPSIHGGTFFTAANVNFYGTRKRRREETSDESPKTREEKCRRMEGEDEIEIIRSADLELIREIGSGPGYLLHAGRNRNRAVIVKVFHKGPTVQQQLEMTVALSKELMHPNVLRIKGISSSHSPSRFIVYENGHCMNAEILLAAALKNDLARSVTLGFTMVAEVSAGISYLCMQGVWSRAGDNALTVFNALLDKTLMSANRVLHKEKIKRDPAIPDPKRPGAVFDVNDEGSDVSVMLKTHVRESREAQDKDRDGAESVGADSRSASTNKRPKRGARKSKSSFQPKSSPRDETLENLAAASQALAREISRASRARSVESNDLRDLGFH
ncbi:hypothetical protein MVEN_01183500 [Mycena venus]|uniref:Protein kinase domain-containing protein n=1 Tax=Mycena venus TaxID=2733690 RepID=A0A8H6Y3V8_9AGAR|nr:hypothetical protein MVEN_01183500 [Mycena venus]